MKSTQDPKAQSNEKTWTQKLLDYQKGRCKLSRVSPRKIGESSDSLSAARCKEHVAIGGI